MQFARQFVYFACDVNPVSISWAQRQFRDRGDIFGMDSKPPLVLGDESMDLVFAWSIFSHYSQYFQQIWITELNRILKPGGYLLISFQSDHLLNQMKSRDMVAETRSENVDLEEFSKSYHNAGFGFYKCYPQTEDNFGFDVENFGMAFISADYIRRNWQKLFDVVRIDAGIVGNFQDLVLLRKL
jgi:SAM-dependent methyltransferase